MISRESLSSRASNSDPSIAHNPIHFAGFHKSCGAADPPARSYRSDLTVQRTGVRVKRINRPLYVAAAVLLLAGCRMPDSAMTPTPSLVAIASPTPSECAELASFKTSFAAWGKGWDPKLLKELSRVDAYSNSGNYVAWHSSWRKVAGILATAATDLLKIAAPADISDSVAQVAGTMSRAGAIALTFSKSSWNYVNSHFIQFDTAASEQAGSISGMSLRVGFAEGLHSC